MKMNKLILRKEIYGDNSLKEAIKAYKKITKIKVKDEKEYYVLKFYFCKYDLKRTMMEFENYLIGIENMKW